MTHLTRPQLEAGLPHILQSPRDDGRLVMIVRRPAVDAREILSEGQLDLALGLTGDTWSARPSRRTPDNSPHPDMQLNIINARLISLLASEPETQALAGDQLYLDLDLSLENLPPGTRLALGEAVIEITAQPHTGCDKFAARFGREALKFVNSPQGKSLRLRGANAKVVQPGLLRPGDRVRKLPA